MATRFEVRVDGESLWFHDDAAAVAYLIGKLTIAEDIDRVLLAAECARSQGIEVGTWDPPAELQEFAAAIRRDLFTPDDMPKHDTARFAGTSYKPGHDSDLAF
jgi:hypothetical protein